jgi:branched-chain amino acid transport system substrate-binding protein
VNRLRFVLVLAVVTVGLAGAAYAQGPVRIGFAHVLSGGMQSFGNVAYQGAMYAVRKINDEGGINGRRVVIVKADTKVKPEVAVQAVRRLVRQEKVDVVMGMVSSAVAKAVTKEMNSLKTPLIVTHAMSNDITGSLCNPWTFRITWNLDQCCKAAALLAHQLGAKTWITVGPDYGFGQETWRRFKYFLGRMGDYKFRPGIFTKLATKDWTSTLERLDRSGADGIMFSLWGSDIVRFMNQARKGGFFRKRTQVIFPVGGAVEVFIGLGFLSNPEGIWYGSPYWYEAYDNQANRDFIKGYLRFMKAGSPVHPSYAVYNAYAAIMMYKAAVEKAGGTDKRAVAQAMAGLTVHGLPVGTTTFRKEDHQAMFDVAYGRTKGVAKGSKRIRGWNPIKLFPGDAITPPASESGCVGLVKEEAAPVRRRQLR